MNALCFVLQQKFSMQWTCQLVVKTGTPPEGRVDGPSQGGFVAGGVLHSTSGSFLSKVTLERNVHMWHTHIHTCASFYLQKSTFTNRTSSVPESFLL